MIGTTNDSKKRHNAAVTKYYHMNRKKVLRYKKDFYYRKKFWLDKDWNPIKPEEVIPENPEDEKKLDELIEKSFNI